MARARKRASSPAPAPVATAVESVDHIPNHNDDGEDGPIARPLSFSEEITWLPGKPISVTVLLRRLKALSSELTEFEQGESGHQSFRNIAKALIGTQLLGNKDAGVRAWTLLCITQIFSIAVPEAPYTAQQLQEIFTAFTKEVLPALADFASPYKQQYVDTLNLLVEDRSIILILDVPNSDKLVLALFKKTFDIMAGKTQDEMLEVLPSNVEYKLVKMLSEIITEADSLEPEIIEIVLAQFLHFATYSRSSDLETSQPLRYPTAYNVARSVCEACGTRMTRYVSDYFSSVLINSSELDDGASAPKAAARKRGHDNTDVDTEASHAYSLSADDLNDARKAHVLLRELWRSCPEVINGIIPQVETELGAENLHMRMMAVEVVGDMIAGIGAIGPPEHVPVDPVGTSDPFNAPTAGKWTGLFKPSAPHAFSAAYASCYQAFLDRSKDKSAAVRAAWATAAGHIFSTNAGGKGMKVDEQRALASHFVTLLRDSDDKARLAAVQAVSTLEFKPLIELLQQDAGDESTVAQILFERIQDKVHHIRKACIELLARAWGAAAHKLGEGDLVLQRVLGDVPSQILEARYKNKNDLNQVILLALHDFLLPTAYPSTKSAEVKVPDSQDSNKASRRTASSSPYDPDTIRARRILVLVRGLSERAQSIFTIMQKAQPRLAKYVSVLLDCCEHLTANVEEQGEHRSRFDTIVDAVSKTFPEPSIAKAHLQQLPQLGVRTWHLIRFCISPASEHSKVVKAMKELQRNISKLPEVQQETWDTLEPFLKGASMLIYNRSHVPAYTHFARTDEGQLAAAADLLIKDISSAVPEVLKIHISELCKDLQHSQPTASNPGTTIATSSSLKACSNFARRFPEDMTHDRAFYQAMVAYALFGSPMAAKQAVSIIVLAAPKKEMLIDKTVVGCVKDFKYGGPQFTTRLAALAQLRLLASEQTESHADEIMKIASADVLYQARVDPQSDDPEWRVSEEVDEDLTAKLLALKVLVNTLRGMQGVDTANTDLRAVARPPYQLLNGLIQGGGELNKNQSSPGYHQAHLRLAAGKSLLKLARDRNFDRYLKAADFAQLARLCQDRRPEVRAEFAKALRKYLGTGKLPSRYLALVFLYAHEPVKEISLSMETWIRSRPARAGGERHDTSFETALPILLSLLAHHQDFGTTTADLAELGPYIIFYLKNVATTENLPAIYSLAQRVKTVQDGINVDKSEDLYLIADLAEAIIRAFQDEKGWSLQMSSTKFQLPSGFFAALPRDVDAQALAEKRFLPDDMVEMIPDIVRAQLKIKRRKQDRDPNGTNRAHGVSKAKTVKKRSSDTGRRASKRSATPDDFDENDSSPEHKRLKRSAAAESHRRSSRQTTASKSYAEADSDEDDEEMEGWDKQMNDEENKENLDHVMEDDATDEDDVYLTKPDQKETPRRQQLVPSRPKGAKSAAIQDPRASQGGRRSARHDERVAA